MQAYACVVHALDTSRAQGEYVQGGVQFQQWPVRCALDIITVKVTERTALVWTLDPRRVTCDDCRRRIGE